MPVISIATSKGGAGKTTVAELICGSCAALGLKTAAIDADLNQTLSTWVTQFSKYQIDAHSELDETKIVPLAGELEDTNDVVVIDTAGAAMQATVFAIGCADLVLIPVQLSSADVIEAIKTLQLVESAAKMTKREIPARVILTDYQPYTNIATHTENELVKANLPILKTKLKRLVGFKEMTFSGKIPTDGAAGELSRKFIAELMSLGIIPKHTLKMAS